ELGVVQKHRTGHSGADAQGGPSLWQVGEVRIGRSVGVPESISKVPSVRRDGRVEPRHTGQEARCASARGPTPYVITQAKVERLRDGWPDRVRGVRAGRPAAAGWKDGIDQRRARKDAEAVLRS